MILSQYYIGPEVDCWSLGICLFKMLTGYCPFRFSTNIINLEYSFNLEDEPISKEAIDLMWKLIEFNVESRITVEEALAHPYLKPVRDPNGEKKHPPAKFEFEDLSLSKKTLKALIIDEVFQYNPEMQIEMKRSSRILQFEEELNATQYV